MSVRLPLLFLATIAVLLAACDGGDDAERRTGIELVDTLIEAVEARDVETIVSMMEFSTTACYTIPRPEGQVAPPAGHGIVCEEGIEDGTPVPSFTHASCEGTFRVAAADGEELVRSGLASTDFDVYGVFAAKEQGGASESGLGGTHAVMLTRDIDGRDAGVALLLGDSGVVGWDTDCGYPPDQMAELNYGEPVLPPLGTSNEQPATSD